MEPILVTAGQMWILSVTKNSHNSCVSGVLSIVSTPTADFSTDFKGTFLLGHFPGQYHSSPQHSLSGQADPLCVSRDVTIVVTVSHRLTS